jgi:hypothetical protein
MLGARQDVDDETTAALNRPQRVAKISTDLPS